MNEPVVDAEFLSVLWGMLRTTGVPRWMLPAVKALPWRPDEYTFWDKKITNLAITHPDVYK